MGGGEEREKATWLQGLVPIHAVDTIVPSSVKGSRAWRGPVEQDSVFAEYNSCCVRCSSLDAYELRLPFSTEKKQAKNNIRENKKLEKKHTDTRRHTQTHVRTVQVEREQSNDRGGEGIGETYPLLHGECDQKGLSRVWDRISR